VWTRLGLKLKNKTNYHTVGTIPILNIKIVDRGKFENPNTQIHDHSLSWLGTITSNKCVRVKLL